MLFFEAPAFARHLFAYLNDEDYRQLQASLASDPETGTVMPETGGFRKLRWPDRRRGKGTRGGLRVIYYYFAEDAQIWFVTLYGKDEMADLTPAQKRVLKAAIMAECQARAKARPATGRRNR